jgi:hypothetical protein
MLQKVIDAFTASGDKEAKGVGRIAIYVRLIWFTKFIL